MVDTKQDKKIIEIIKIPYGYGKDIAEALGISETYLSTICNNGGGSIVIRTKLKKEVKKLHKEIVKSVK